MAVSDWRERSEYWLASAAERPKRKLRERSAETLILCGHGIAMRVENGTLVIRNGFTHYPQEQEQYRYFRGDLERPARIVVLDGSGHLTFDVIDWLAEQAIPLIRVNWQGHATTVIGGTGYGADRGKIEWQLASRADSLRRVTFGIDLIARKITNAIGTMDQSLPASFARDRAIVTSEKLLSQLKGNPPTTIAQLHGVEGPAAAAYFEAWQATPLHWQSTKRCVIPDAWRSLGPRSSVRAGKARNRNATHPVNAMLNYGYAIAVAQLKIRALADGYDPSLGIMHDAYRDSPAFALDLVEPVRPLVDRAILRLTQTQGLSSADFVIRSDGACRLNPQLARRVVQIAQEARLKQTHPGQFQGPLSG